MSHPNRFPPELLALDNQMEEFWAEYRKKIHLVPKFAGERAEAKVADTTQPQAKTSSAKPLSIWARAWLKVAKGIIG